VFFGRFVLGLRVWASWLAGATHMRWRLFFLWNALGGITWATAIGLAAYFLGHSAGGAVEAFGLYGLVALAIAIGSVLLAHRRSRRHRPPANDSGDVTVTAPHSATEDLGKAPTQAAPGDSPGG
jgi:membrane protein DedA with SNARE-associated domain